MALLIDAHPDGRARGVAEDLAAETARVDRDLGSSDAPDDVFDIEQSRQQMRSLARLAAANYQRPEMPTEDRRIWTPAGDVAVRVYAPANSGALIVLVHGGGWIAGDIDTHDSMARWLAVEAGASVAVIGYSLAPEHPYPRGITEVGAVITSLGREIDATRRLVVIGDSAGANIAAMALLQMAPDDKARVNGFISMYGPYAPAMDLSSHRLYGDGRFGLSAARMHWCWTLYAPHLARSGGEDLTPLGKDLSDFPPTLCIGAEYDLLLDDTLALYSELAATQVDVSLALWPGLTHGCFHYVGAVASVTRAARGMLPFVNGTGRAHPQPVPFEGDDSSVVAEPSSPRSVPRERPSAGTEARQQPRRHGSVAHKLGIQILRGEMAPGQLLPTEENASAAMGISRSAYREAMRTLSAKGLIKSSPKVGTKIAPRSAWNILDPDLLSWSFEAEPDEKFIRDLFELRNAVEPAAAAMAAERRDDDDLASLSGALARMVRESVGSGGSFDAEVEFHRGILLASHNEALMGLWSAIELTLRWSAKLQLMLPVLPSVSEGVVSKHSRLLEKISTKSAQDAQVAMSHLIKASLTDAIANLRQVRRLTGAAHIV